MQSAPAGARAARRKYKPWPLLWLPFGLRRIDGYYCKFYLRSLLLILVALGSLVAIGDIFQRFDEFILLARRDNLSLWGIARVFLHYYASWIPQLILQYMLPVAMLLAAT